MPRRVWLLTLLLSLGAVSPAVAQPLAPIAPGGPPPSTPTDYDTPGIPPPADTITTESRRPPNILGAPVLGAPVRAAEQPIVAPIAPAASVAPITPVAPISPVVGYGDPQPAPSLTRGAVIGMPVSSSAPVSARLVERDPRTTYAPSADAVNDFLTKRSGYKDRDREPYRETRSADREPYRETRSVDREYNYRDSGRSTRSHSVDDFGERINDAVGKRNEWFRSDHCFDGFISPVTNPFLFEDPRSLTELRPIFIYQKMPSKQPDFSGGNTGWFGTQARVAFTDRLSFTFNKIGGTWVNPGDGSTLSNEAGFSELWLGPKYTIIRGEDSGSLLAAGLQFQLPIGASSVYQSTGDLSLVPYVTYGKNFCRDLSIGSFNALIGTGYSFSTNKARSDYYWLSAHLDLDIMNNHRFYPLTELNWVINTTNGSTLPIGSEGRDLFNFGGQASGKGLLTWAIGGRVKATEWAQFGAAFELPVAGARDLFQYRFTLDFILRY